MCEKSDGAGVGATTRCLQLAEQHVYNTPMTCEERAVEEEEGGGWSGMSQQNERRLKHRAQSGRHIHDACRSSASPPQTLTNKRGRMGRKIRPQHRNHGESPGRAASEDRVISPTQHELLCYPCSRRCHRFRTSRLLFVRLRVVVRRAVYVRCISGITWLLLLLHHYTWVQRSWHLRGTPNAVAQFPSGVCRWHASQVSRSGECFLIRDHLAMHHRRSSIRAAIGRCLPTVSKASSMCSFL